MSSYLKAPRSSRLPLALSLASLLPVLTIGGGLAVSADKGEKPAPTHQAAYEKEVKPLFKQFCEGCHGPSNAAGGINLAKYATVTDLQKDQATWRKVLAQLRERSMPPRGLPKPTPQQNDHLVHWLNDALNNVDPSLLPKNPGRVLIHRLSRMEYNNTVRDLFGVHTRPADKFPPDGGGGGGFDNNADTLFVPPILMEKYLAAAAEILDAARPERIFLAKPDKKVTPRMAARKILDHYAMRAWRRPVEPAEVNRLLTLYDAAAKRGDSHENAVKYALKAVLISPNFLFRVEKDRLTAEAYPIDEYELASRLSYFLWASMPDEELFKIAGQKKLRDPKVLEAQVRRMIQSPKSRALADGFASQWLRIRDLYTLRQPDPRRNPEYNPSLRNANYNETLEYFQSLFREDASLLRLHDAHNTYLNHYHPKHY
ncbi:MAG: DUF1592 domain-containing protein, partial [Armatimonadetes bacterium]|nr:DUF1592 domain-containing protein [Armatimonadota bacterium]